MHDGKRTDDDRSGLRRLALQLAVQLPIDRQDALAVLAALREILDVLHDEAAPDLPNSS